MQSFMTIGQVARQAGVTVETVRFYQRQRLIAEPKKPLSGYRLYGKDTIARLRFIKRAQELGFTLKEISNLLLLGDGHCADTKGLAAKKLATVKAKIADLQAMRKVLEELIRKCETNPDQKSCPLVTSLAVRSPKI